MTKSITLVIASIFLAACSGFSPGVSTSAVTEYPSGPDAGNADYDDSPRGIDYFGGPLMTSPTIFVLYYGARPPWAPVLERFFGELSNSPLMHVLSTYIDPSGNVPPGGLTINVQTTPITLPDFHGDILTPLEAKEIINKSASHSDLNALYMIVIGVDSVIAKAQNGLTICDQACDFHSTVPVANDVNVVYRYAMIGDYWACNKFPDSKGNYGKCLDHYTVTPNCVSDVEDPAPACDPIADTVVTKAWHELAEAITDPWPSLGHVSYSSQPPTGGGGEGGDLCEDYVSDPTSYPGVGYVQQDLKYQTANGGMANIHLGSHDYLIQGFWQNIPGGGCVRRIAINKPAVAPIATGDFNGGGVGDLLFRNLLSGQVSTVQLTSAGATEPGGGVFATFAATAEVYGVADFNGDGKADVLWGNPNTNHLVVSTNVDGTNESTTELIATNTFPAGSSLTNPPPIQVQAVGDFNGDGYSDLLFLDHVTNKASVWLNTKNILSGFTPFTESALKQISLAVGPIADTIGTGFFDSSGRSAVLWRNWDGGATVPRTPTYSYSYWTFNAAGTIATNHALTLPADHIVVGIANVNGDAISDIVAKSGSYAVWIDIAASGSGHIIDSWPDPVWRYAGGTRLGGAGNALIWSNRQTGAVMLWTLDADGKRIATTYPIGPQDFRETLVAY